MIIRHALSVALLTALAGIGAPTDAHSLGHARAAQDAKPSAAKANGLVPHYVRHKAGQQHAMQAELLAQGGQISYYLDAVDTYVVDLPEQVAPSLASGKNAVLVERVPEHKLAAQVVPWNVDQFQARDIWDKNRDGSVDVGAPDGSGITICVIDTGFHQGHSDFAGITVNGTTEGSVGTWFTDGNGHGTHVAGTINAVNNDRGVVGVLPGAAELYIVKVFNDTGNWGGGSLAAAADKCRLGGADVISMSLGGGASVTEEAMFQNLYDNFGILNVAAAGNDGNDVPSAPAMYESVVMVAAINEQEGAAEFSQTPPTAYDPANVPANGHWDMVEFSGGGVQVLSTVPTPDGEVPVYRASFGGVDYYGSRVAADAPEITPEGNVSAPLVNGGRCRNSDPAQVWTGAIVICERGDVAFSEKINRVRAQGGAAAIIYNNIPGDLGATCGPDCDQPSIPSLSLSQARGQALLAAGAGQTVNLLIDDGSPCAGCEGGYDFYNGTSMATPGVSGAMAFAWNACGGPASVTNKQVRQLLRDSAKDLTGTQPADPGVSGDAPIVYGAGYDRVTGWGLVQLADALALGNERFGSSCPIALSATPTVRDVCTLNAASTTFALTLDAQFTGTSTASASGAPSGASGSFSLNPIVHPANTSIYTLTGLTSAAAGTHRIDFSVVDNANPNNIGTASADLTITHAMPAATVLQTPANGAGGVSTLPILTWQAAAEATQYLVQVATDAAFSNIVHTASVSGTSHTVSTMLSGDTQYYWRVVPQNGCGTASPAIASFRTAQSFCASPGLAIPDNNTTGVSSTITVPITGNMTDVDIAVMASHTWIGDLDARLTHGAQTNRLIVDRPGGSGCDTDSLDVTLDDEAAGAIACPPVGTFRPTNVLTVFDGTSVNGSWTLNVRDRAGLDTGTFLAWCVIPSVSGGGANSAPVFQGEPYAYSVNAGASNGSPVGSVVATDADSGQTLSYAIAGGNTGGAFAINAGSGAITVADASAVTPANGPFSLSVTVSDGVSGLDSTTVTITVTSSGNQAPVAVADAMAVAEGGTATTLVGGASSVRSNDTDAEDGTPTGNVSVGTTPVNGALTLNADGTFSYIHDGGQSTSDSFTYRVRDSGGVQSNAATVTISISGVNDSPIATGSIANRTDAEGAAVTQATAANFNDADGDTLSYSATGLPPGLSIAPSTGLISGTLAFTANAGSPFNVVVTATDPSNASATQAFEWTVTNTNRAPAAVGTISNRSDAEGAVVTQATAASFSDADSDTLTYSATGLPTGLSINAASGEISGTLAFTANASSPFNVVVTATDPSNASATQAFEWTVTNTNRAPAAVGTISNRSDAEGAVVTQATAASFSDADSDTLTYSATGLPTGLSINAASGEISGTLAFTANASSPFNVVVTATDASNASATQAFEWTVTDTPQNQAPVVSDQAYSVTVGSANGTVVGSIVASDPDAGDTRTFSVMGGTGQGLFNVSAAGEISVANATGLTENTALTLNITVTDAGGLTDTAVITITVQPLRVFGNGFEGN
ncbi:MAG: putative Ig domain-containing protein [Chiayiivirga sp.]|jgi:VCBS repeat-containing protein|nr:putative Ig domain-containing protein [Chiayiivirga sp.]